jgi:tripartite-type tricarboxylate transporter receptor subunit TctC
VVSKAPPDGYTLLFTDLSTHTITGSLYAKLPYDPLKSFAPVTAANSSPLLLVVHPSVGAKSVRSRNGSRAFPAATRGWARSRT